MSRMAPGMQNFVAIGLGIFALEIRDFAVPFGVTSFYVRFFWVINMATAYAPERIFTQNCQKTSFQVRKCLLGVTITIVNI